MVSPEASDGAMRVLMPAADRHQGMMDVRRRVAHPRTRVTVGQGTGMGNELSRVVDALPGLAWTAVPGGRIGIQMPVAADALCALRDPS